MNKTDLINALAERLDGNKKTAQAAVEGFIDLVQREVHKGESVSISGFGVFEKRARAARTARNPRTGEAVKVKKTTVPAFRPGKYFKDVIAGSVKMPKATGKPTTARAAAAAARTAASSTPARTRATAARAATAPAATSRARADQGRRSSTGQGRHAARHCDQGCRHEGSSRSEGRCHQGRRRSEGRCRKGNRAPAGPPPRSPDRSTC